MKKPLEFDQDDFIQDEFDDAVGAKEGLEAIIDSLVPLNPPADLTKKVLGTLSQRRFERFADDVADLLDIDAEQAQKLLDGVDQDENWSAGPVEGMTLYHVEGGPKVDRAITGFTRIEAGGGFPEHKHLGKESILILQGYFKDTVTGVVHGPGEVVHMEPDTSHGFELLEGGTRLTYLVVVQEGVELGGMPIMYDSPLL